MKCQFETIHKEFGKFKVSVTAKLKEISKSSNCRVYISIGEHLISVSNMRLDFHSKEGMESLIENEWREFNISNDVEDYSEVRG